MSDCVELVFGLVGPIGCLIHEARDSLESTLKTMDYTPVIINLSAEMDSLLKAKGCVVKDEFESTFEEKILKGMKLENGTRNIHETKQLLLAALLDCAKLPPAKKCRSSRF